MPNCYVCKKSIDSWLESKRGQKFCSENCFKQTWPKCTACLSPMQQWQENDKGLKFCSDTCAKTAWPKCSICSAPMNEWIAGEQGKQFCSEGCFKQTWPKCTACLSPMQQWQENDKGLKFCSGTCAKTAWPKCDVCFMPMQSWSETIDGKRFCSGKCLGSITSIDIAALQIGAHIISPKFCYTHHGIYIGDNSVVHYSGLSNGLSAGPIEITTLELFSGERDIISREYNSPRYTGQLAVDRALSRLGEDDYDVHANNCEHFCSWVITGKSVSQQVEAVEDFIDITIPGNRLIALVKARKHLKQGLATAEIGKDIADIGLKAVVFSTMPAAIPVYAVYKALKRML